MFSSTIAPASARLDATQPTTQSESTVDRLRRLYKTPHQVELLYLQAEVDTLLRQLQSLKPSDVSCSSDRN